MRSGDGRTAAEWPYAVAVALGFAGSVPLAAGLGAAPAAATSPGAGGLPEPAARRRRPRPRHRRVRGHVTTRSPRSAPRCSHRAPDSFQPIQLFTSTDPRHVDPGPGYGPLGAYRHGRRTRRSATSSTPGRRAWPRSAAPGSCTTRSTPPRRRALPGGGHVDLGRRALCDAGLPPSANGGRATGAALGGSLDPDLVAAPGGTDYLVWKSNDGSSTGPAFLWSRHWHPVASRSPPARRRRCS